jgi:hypothetical protein
VQCEWEILATKCNKWVILVSKTKERSLDDQKQNKKQKKTNPKQNAHPFSVQEQPQEVAEVLPAAAKKASKVQLRLCCCRASRFSSFLQSAIRPIYSAFMWFVKQAWLLCFLRCRRSPVSRWKQLQLQRHALVCDVMHHCATDLTEPCRPDDQCDSAIDCHCMSYFFWPTWHSSK